MMEIGNTLHDARLRRGLDLAEVERRTRIRARFLAAMEEERFELLPGEAYVKPFLREYAESLGLDARALVDEYSVRFGKAAPPPAVELHAVEVTPSTLARNEYRTPLRKWPFAVAVVGIALVAAFALAALLGGTGRTHGRAPSRVSHTATRPGPSPAASKPSGGAPVSSVPVRLHALAPWDPYGDGHEHDSDVPRATDGDPSTYWRTETYYDGLLKPGVGLLLDAGTPVRLARLVLSTDTPGYTASIEAGSSPAGPFRSVSDPRTVATTTTFALSAAAAARYYVLWITKLDHRAHVNELRAIRLVRSGG